MKQRPAKGLWSLFARKAENLLNRAAGVPSSTAVQRTKSLQVPDSPPPTRPRSIELLSPAISIRHSRRLSFSLSGSSRTPGEGERVKQDVSVPVFSAAVSRIVASSSILSTSAGITFPPPGIITALAEKEKDSPDRKLFGFEKVQLHSLLGWEGRESRGRGMGGLSGFFRHQGISVLYAEYIPRSGFQQEASSTTTVSRQTVGESEESKSTNTESSNSSNPTARASQTMLTPCERGRWITYRYFERDTDVGRSRKYADCSMGAFIEYLVCCGLKGEEKCERAGCEARRKDHRRFWIHGGIRISAETIVQNPEKREEDIDVQGDRIEVWESCEICKKETERRRMSDGT